MLVLILILALVVLLGLGFAVAMWFASRYRQKSEMQSPASASRPKVFRSKYLVAPLVVLALSIVISALFYPRLPADVGYHFAAGGSPDRWLPREGAVALMVVPQLLVMLLARNMIAGVAKLGIVQSMEGNAGRIFMLMGNIAALPQLILFLVMVDIFTYNSYNIRIMPGWTWTAVLGIATAVLVALLIPLIQRMRRRLA